MEFFMQKIILFVLLVVLAGSPVLHSQSNAGSSLTVNEALKRAVQNRPLLKQKEEELQSLHYRIEQQKSSYMPEVDAQVSYLLMGPLPSFSFGGENLELAPANNYNAVIAARQILYDFGKRDAQANLLHSYRQTIIDEQNVIKTELTNQTVRVFYAILFLKQSIIEKDSEATTLKEHLKITEGKIASGTATDYDVLSTNSKIAEIENAVIELKSEQTKQELNLKELIGMNRRDPVAISGDFFTSLPVVNSDSLVDVAWAQRQELKLVLDAQSSAKLQKASASLNDKPVLRGEVVYGFKNGYQPNIDVLRGNWLVNLTLGIPIFNGNQTENREHEIEAGLLASDQRLNQLRETVSTEVFQAVNELKSNQEKLAVTEKQIGYASKSLERAQYQYDSGSGTNLDVLDAATMLTQARMMRLQVMFREVLNFYSLKKAVGDKLFE